MKNYNNVRVCNLYNCWALFQIHYTHYIKYFLKLVS